MTVGRVDEDEIARRDGQCPAHSGHRPFLVGDLDLAVVRARDRRRPSQHSVVGVTVLLSDRERA